MPYFQRIIRSCDENIFKYERRLKGHDATTICVNVRLCTRTPLFQELRHAKCQNCWLSATNVFAKSACAVPNPNLSPM